jgi:hypothetical protein
MLSSSTFPQIPNNSFENWDQGEPVDWLTSNLNPLIAVTQSSDAHSGSSSARLEILLNGFSAESVALYSGSDGNGFPCTQRHASITGYYKLVPQGPDILSVSVQVWQGANQLGTGVLSITTAASSWTQFMAPITYTAPGTPDRCSVRFVFRVTDFTTVGGVAYIDDLEFSGINDIEVIDNGQIPGQYILKQNYPNPFNPSTNIHYELPVNSFVNLKVYDVLGNEVAVLMNEEKPAGSYEIEFSAIGGSASGGNAEGLTSGVYFYQLKAGNFSGTKKMILSK